jgi:hypothetical protein
MEPGKPHPDEFVILLNPDGNAVGVAPFAFLSEAQQKACTREQRGTVPWWVTPLVPGHGLGIQGLELEGHPTTSKQRRTEYRENAQRVERQHLRSLEAQRDTAYQERNELAALLARPIVYAGTLDDSSGFRAGVGHDANGEPGFQTVLFVDLPTGQVSWHIPDEDRHLLNGLPHYERGWDGHSTAEKRDRVRQAFAGGTGQVVTPLRSVRVSPSDFTMGSIPAEPLRTASPPLVSHARGGVPYGHEMVLRLDGDKDTTKRQEMLTRFDQLTAEERARVRDDGGQLVLRREETGSKALAGASDKPSLWAHRQSRMTIIDERDDRPPVSAIPTPIQEHPICGARDGCVRGLPGAERLDVPCPSGPTCPHAPQGGRRG